MSASVNVPVKATEPPSLRVVGVPVAAATGALFTTVLKFWTWLSSVALIPARALPERFISAAAPVAASAAA